jgi:hypothetical protein
MYLAFGLIPHVSINHMFIWYMGPEYAGRDAEAPTSWNRHHIMSNMIKPK